MRGTYLIRGGSIILLGLIHQPALASGLMDEITVTAQKTEQSSQDVGIAITAFDAEMIREIGFRDTTDIVAMSPGVQVNYPNGLSSFSFSVRGVTQTDFSDHQEAPVALYLDDVYVSQMAGAGFQLFDTERIEVLRGPQGTLFGRNATGGLMHVITKRPGDTLSGYAEVGYGAHNHLVFEGAAGGPISQVLSMRASVKYEQHDGYIKNLSGPDGNDAENYAGRIQFLAKLGDRGTFLLNLRGGESNVDAPQYWKNAAATVGPTGVGVFTDGDVSGNVHRGSWNLTGHHGIQTYGISGTLTLDFDSVTFTSITDYSHLKKSYLSDADEGATSTLLHFGGRNRAQQFSQEVRFNGRALDRVEWVAGTYYLDIEGQYHSSFVAPFTVGLLGFAPFNAVYNEFAVATRSWAVFGQADIEIAPAWTLTAGFRWTQENKKHDYANYLAMVPDVLDPQNVPLDTLLQIGAFNPALNGDLARIDDGLWSAKVALNWQPTDDLLLYASWNRGVKAGSFNAPVFSLPHDQMKFGPEVLLAYELGGKSSLFDNRLRLNASVFYYDYEDIQTFQLEGFTQIVRNKPGRTKGLEIELITSPMDGLELMAGFSYLDAVIKDVAAGLVIIDARPQMSPKWNVSGLAKYEWPAFGGTMSVLVDFSYLSAHYFDISNADVVRQAGYILGNARLAYRTADERWEASVFVENIGDKSYASWAYDIAALTGVIEKTYGRPRWFGVSLRYSFN